MYGLMQDVPLSLTRLFVRGETLHADQEIVTAGNGPSRVSFAAWCERTRRLVAALNELKVQDYARVATFAWNTADHLSAYFAVPCSRRVLHTLNIRMAPSELAYVINHAEDEVILVDAQLLDRLQDVLAECRTVRHVIVIGGADSEMPASLRSCAVHDLGVLLDQHPPADLVDPDDERRAAAMCYTSGTTGMPKGVLYSHRSMVLHSFGVQAANSLGIGESDRVCPIVPMFHANAWGLPHAAIGAGAALILPGSDNSAKALAQLLEQERVTVASAVPTVWVDMLEELETRDLHSMRIMNAGGSSVSPGLSAAYQAATGRPLTQGWGMTEMSPIGAVFREPTIGHDAPFAPGRQPTMAVGPSGPASLSVGRPVMGVDVRIVDPEADTTVLPWDGQAAGELQTRGPWIASGYYRASEPGAALTADGWLKTGDLARVDPQGFIYILDRFKDLIKSGGEWISSVTLEEAIRAHPDITDAAVIGVHDPRWQERPMTYITVRESAAITPESLRAFLSGAVPAWWAPDYVKVVPAIPRTSTGKIDKQKLRMLWDAEPTM
jgi:fatty-acyl-CoA synthase